MITKNLLAVSKNIFFINSIVVVMMFGSAPNAIAHPISFNADHPFIMQIIKNGTILFTGSYRNSN